ncbi:MAG: hypothetical protein KGI67_05090 [Pseudomonadota bacterium]|nr:hypothetical protein [Pseudomonadota bacterium]
MIAADGRGQRFRVRVSSALLALALAGTPTASDWLRLPPVPELPWYWTGVARWALYGMALELFTVAAPIALVMAAMCAYRRQWYGLLQSLLEVTVCVACLLLLPLR